MGTSAALRRGPRRLGCAVALALALLAAPLRAQSVELDALTAAFLYNFARFTEWPDAALPPRAPMLLCADREGLSRALEEATRGRAVDGHPIAVRTVAAEAGQAASCHVLYVSRLEPPGVRRLLARLGDAPVLTASDTSGFARLGGVAELYLEDGRMRFAINPAAALRANLTLSSRLLSLARIERP